LQRLTGRGLTVFLTSHVLEIVERLCTHIGIIAEGRLVTTGALDELRRGIEIGDDAGDGRALSLEDYFIRVVGGARPAGDDALSWLN
jgi:ABC-2 type transport system ATP-binding protein